MFDRISLRKKIVLLALLPALVACLIFAALVATSSRRASALVRENVTQFMVERTVRSLFHAHASAETAANYSDDLLRLHLTIAQLVVRSKGGFELAGAPVARQLAGDGEHVGGTILLQPMRVGGETVVSGRSDTLEEIAHKTGALTVLFERVNGSGEMVRISATSPTVQLNTFLSAHDAGQGDSAAAAVTSGAAFTGRTLEGNAWHIGRYEPLLDSHGAVIGALYLGLPVQGMASLQHQLIANAVGTHGTVVLLYAHGPQRGQMISTPTGIAATTESEWLPKALAESQGMQDAQEGAMNIYSPADKADAIVRFGYLARYDWVVVTVADSRDLEQASSAVKNEFSGLMVRSLIGAVLVLLVVALVSALISRRIVDPLLEITIQLTSNGTQVASSANQQMSHAQSFNVSSTEIATAVKEISSTSQELLRAMEELSQEATRASEAAKVGSKGLLAMGRTIEALSRATATISESLNGIRAQATNINAVTLAVTKVADQTNLLSLNAAIEAERAGDAGAGFAVVAREIRRLADRSANSSQEIEQTVHEMQDAVTAGVAEVRSLSAAVDESVAASDRIREQFTEIIDRVEAMTPRYEMVHLGMQNQNEGALQISQAMWQLTESAGQTSDAIAELNQVSLELHKAVGILKKRIFQDESGSPRAMGGLGA